jgi:hypothetical protein
LSVLRDLRTDCVLSGVRTSSDNMFPFNGGPRSGTALSEFSTCVY